MTTTVTKTIGTAANYTTMQAWEDASATDLTLSRASITVMGSTSSTIVLDALASGVDGFYNGHAVWCDARATEKRLITGYVGATKVATIGVLNGSSATWATTPGTEAFTVDSTIWRGEMFNQEFVIAGSLLTISGQTANAANYMELTTTAGASFADHANKLTNALRYNASNGAAMRLSGAGYALALSIATAFTRISKFQFKDEGAPSGGAIAISAADCQVSQVIAETNGAGSGAAAFKMTAGGAIFRNCVAVNTSVGVNAAAFASNSGTTTYYNCTAIKPSNIGAFGQAYQTAYSSAVIKNCAGFGFTSFYASIGGAASATGNNNASDVTISFGTSNQASLTYANQIEQPNSTTGLDCRAKSGAAIIDTGADLSASGVTIDIVGTARGATYDIGVWEFSSALATIIGTLAITLAAATLSSTGSLSIVGQAAITTADATLSSTGTLSIVGQATITLADATLSAAGINGNPAIPSVGAASRTTRGARRIYLPQPEPPIILPATLAKTLPNAVYDDDEDAWILLG